MIRQHEQRALASISKETLGLGVASPSISDLALDHLLAMGAVAAKQKGKQWVEAIRRPINPKDMPRHSRICWLHVNI